MVYLYVAYTEETWRDNINQIAEDIAPYWDDIGIQLDIENVERFKTNENLAEYKFKAMFKKWLEKQTCTNQEMLRIFYIALRRLLLNQSAEEFCQKLKKLNIFIKDDIN